MARTHVVIFLRPRRPHGFSIERVVEAFAGHLPTDIDWTIERLPHPAFTPLALLRNGLHARRHGGDVNHISGDVHYLALFLPRRRTVLTIHDAIVLERLRGWKRQVIRWLQFVLPVKRSAVVTVISRASRAASADLAGISLADAVVVPDPLPFPIQAAPAAFTRPERPPVFLTIGTKRNKNIDRCIRAAAGLPCRLLLIGPLSEAHEALLAETGVAFENRRDLADEELRQAYRDADALLFPSLAEGFGMPILEAQACGRPVITSDRSSMPEVAGDAALLVDPESVEAIRAGMRRLIDDPTCVAGLVEAGYRNVRRFEPTAVAEAYAAVYRSVADRAGRRERSHG